VKIVSYRNQAGRIRAGLVVDNRVYDLKEEAAILSMNLPDNVMDLLEDGESRFEDIRRVEQSIDNGKVESGLDLKDVRLLAPVPKPPSCRDAYAFRQHVTMR